MNRKAQLCVAIIALLLLPLYIGCGNGHVKAGGSVIFPDGSPVTSGSVKFETPTNQYVGAIQANGTFQLGGVKAGDGLPPGKYKVSVLDVRDTATDTPILDEKFESADSSGLEFEVTAGKNEPFKVVVERSPKPRTRPKEAASNSQ